MNIVDSLSDTVTMLSVTWVHYSGELKKAMNIIRNFRALPQLEPPGFLHIPIMLIFLTHRNLSLFSSPFQVSRTSTLDPHPGNFKVLFCNHINSIIGCDKPSHRLSINQPR